MLYYISVFIGILLGASGAWHLHVHNYKKHREICDTPFTQYTRDNRRMVCIEIIFFVIMGAVCGIACGLLADGCVYELTRIRHIKNPCPQCQFKRIERTWYDNDHNPHSSERYKWIGCSTLKDYVLTDY